MLPIKETLACGDTGLLREGGGGVKGGSQNSTAD